MEGIVFCHVLVKSKGLKNENCTKQTLLNKFNLWLLAARGDTWYLDTNLNVSYINNINRLLLKTIKM